MFRKMTIVGVIVLATRVASAAPTAITACGSIAAPGSYQLAHNLNAAGNCLVLKAGRVTLDLNGFLISGNGTGAGITDGGITLYRTVIRNGNITGFQTGIDLSHSQITTVDQVVVANGQTGIRAGIYAAVTDCSVDSSSANAIVVGNDCLVTNNMVNNNGKGTSTSNIAVNPTSGNGITGGVNCLISGNNVSGNGQGVGIYAGNAALVVHNVASADYGGIIVGDASGVLDNSATRNSHFGIGASRGSTVAQNSAAVNGVAANGAGIEVHEWSLISGNAASSNAYGFRIYCPSALVSDTAFSNTVQNYFFFFPPCASFNNL
jgi:hypothetical protein